MKKNLLTCLLVTTFLTSNVFARGTYYVGEESDNYVINLGGDNAENMVSYENKVKVDNLSGNDSITIKNAIFEGANLAVKISFSLIGIMAFWLGVMRVAEKSGLTSLIAKCVN